MLDSSSERVESRTSVSSVHNKRESSKDDNKTKDNELKAKRSNTSVNGKKDSVEIVSKVIEILHQAPKQPFTFFSSLWELQTHPIPPHDQ